MPLDLVGAFIGTAGSAIKELVGQVGMPVRVRPNPSSWESQTAVIGPCAKSENSAAVLDRAEQIVQTKIANLRKAPWESWAVPVGGLVPPERARSPYRRRDQCSGGGCVPRGGCRPHRTSPVELSVLHGDEAWEDEDEPLEEGYEPYPSNWHGLDDLAWEAAVAAGWEDEDDGGDGEWPEGDGEWPEEEGERPEGDDEWPEGDDQRDGEGQDGDEQGGGDWPDGDGEEPDEEEEGEEEEEENHEGDQEEDDPNEDEEEEGWGEGEEEEEEEDDWRGEQEEEHEEQEAEEEFEYEGDEEIELWASKGEHSSERESQKTQRPQQEPSSGSSDSDGPPNLSSLERPATGASSSNSPERRPVPNPKRPATAPTIATHGPTDPWQTPALDPWSINVGSKPVPKAKGQVKKNPLAQTTPPMHETKSQETKRLREQRGEFQEAEKNKLRSGASGTPAAKVESHTLETKEGLALPCTPVRARVAGAGQTVGTDQLKAKALANTKAGSESTNLESSACVPAAGDSSRPNNDEKGFHCCRGGENRSRRASSVKTPSSKSLSSKSVPKS